MEIRTFWLWFLCADTQCRRLCSVLLSGKAGPKAGDPMTKAVGAAALAFFRQVFCAFLVLAAAISLPVLLEKLH